MDGVKLFVYTGENGAIGVHGQVEDPRLIEEIKTFVEGTHPPRPVVMFVRAKAAEGEENQ